MQETLSQIIQSKSLVTDKSSLHSYCDEFYEKELARYRNLPVSIVEIGIDQGGSLILWAEYFANARILGIDLQLRGDCAKNCGAYQNIMLSIGNAYMYESIQFYPEMDIFIDDGPHDPDSQVWAVKNLSHRVRPGGLFVIEDVTSIAVANQLLEATPFHLRDYVEIIDLRPKKNRSDDILFVIRIPGIGKHGQPAVNRPGYSMMLERTNHIKKLIDFNKIQNVLDVGAAHGYETLNMASIFPNARVFGFEADPMHFDACMHLHQGTEAGLKERMFYNHLAVNDVEGPLTFYAVDRARSRGGNTGMASKLQLIDPAVFPHEYTVQTPIQVQATTLDKWCLQNKILPDVLWMDVQGAELDVLKGAEAALVSIEVIFSEVGLQPYYHGHTLKHDIDAFLMDRGFVELANARSSGHSHEVDTIYVKQHLLK
jgi:FkbM family methyltransferase